MYWPLLTLTFALSFFFLRSLVLTHFKDTQEADILFPFIFRRNIIIFLKMHLKNSAIKNLFRKKSWFMTVIRSALQCCLTCPVEKNCGFITKKMLGPIFFSAFYGQRLVTEPGPTPIPWSIFIIKIGKIVMFLELDFIFCILHNSHLKL